MQKMPVLFIGHGSPMNAIEENQYSLQWEKLSARIPRPQAVLSVSAHWYTTGTRVTDSPAPNMVYDMYGFPDELYQVTYNAPGSPHFASMTKELLHDNISVDRTWGLDHGSWSVLRRIYPHADIPVFQLSVDRLAPAKIHFEIGRKLRTLRQHGVLIMGSGNIVHNLSRVNWDMSGGFSWAEEFDNYIRDNILKKNFENVIHYEKAGSSSALAFPALDHFAPLLYALGASEDEDHTTVFNEACMLGALSMTSYLFE